MAAIASSTSSTICTSTTTEQWKTFPSKSHHRLLFKLNVSTNTKESVGYFHIYLKGSWLIRPFNAYDPFCSSHDQSRLGNYEHLSRDFKHLTEKDLKSFDKYLTNHDKRNLFQITTKLQKLITRSLGYKSIKLQFSELQPKEYQLINPDIQTEKPIAPFDLLFKVLYHEDIFGRIILNTLAMKGCKKFKPRVVNELFTSCTITAFALSAIFYGTEQFKCVNSLISVNFKQKFVLKTKETEDIQLFCKNIFKGIIITELRINHPSILEALINYINQTALAKKMTTEGDEKDSETHEQIAAPDDSLDCVYHKIYELYDKLFSELSNTHLKKHVENELQKRKIQSSPEDPQETVEIPPEEIHQMYLDAISNCCYNRRNLSYLIYEIKTNAQLTSNTKFFYYYIQLENFLGKVDHTFFIEQYQRASDQTTCYRIYQSWIRNTTLYEDIQRRGYESYGCNSLDESQIDTFLNNLEDYLIYRGDPLKSKIMDNFGFSIFSLTTPITSYDKETKVLRSRDLVYWCEEVNPNDCLKNLKELSGQQ